MSEKVGQLFKTWMIATGKSKNTASNYFTGVNIVSKHCGLEVFDIDDVDELEQLYQLYGPKGVHAEVGASNSNNVQSGLKQWLEYQRLALLGQDDGLWIDPVEGGKQWDKFLARWPLSKLRELTLEQYYGEAGDDSFYSWMRDRTAGLGYFKEGPLSAGVRPLSANSKATSGADTQTDGGYIWYSILGNSAQEAFEHLKAELVTAADAVQRGDLSLMAGLENAPGALVWKVAFLYQDRTQPLVLPFYTQKQLKRIAGPHATGTTQDLRQRLMSQRGEKDVLEFAAELEKLVMNTQMVKEEKDSPTMANTSVALNQILFGPPGTGKTYATFEAALEVLDRPYLEVHRNERAALKARFDQLADEGRIRFVTFHQSFSYEDFVEGLRAESDEASGQLRYEVVDGVFKQMCYLELSIRAAAGDVKVEPTQRVISFRFGSLGAHDEEIASVIEEKRIQFDRQDVGPGDLVLVTDGIQFLRAVGMVVDTNITEEGLQSGQLVANMNWLRVLEPPVPLSEVVPNPSAVHRSYFLRPDGVQREVLQRLISEPESIVGSLEEPKSKVLIIDEINRGNISRIFGELITLIERSKRAGAEEALSVVLPYSKQRFSVPANVHLIGTMNTTDRSLAGLDIALRRRFEFREMPPRPELLDGVKVEKAVDIGQLLRVMNERIEVLLDRDHCLGHAYFMPLKTEPTLERLSLIFRNQVLPLLQEYFFEDWQRIQWVLNDHRKADVDCFVHRKSSSVQALFGADVNLGPDGQTWNLNEEAFERLEAYLGIVDHQHADSLAAIKQEAVHGDLLLRELASGSIEVWRAGVRQSPSKPLLRAVAGELGVGVLNGHDNPLNTQALGRQLIRRLRADLA
ncbi:AAA family ATPase [Pseudomonas resinovorans]|uniref:McrB family protein n=1 Tax=Metapseudomonas resinovorans TaxID=53412 RepID=UPI00237F6421|nr:AAA family ATPase [Pseudomonas resinovorans]MDE3735933.1 AAA family ATPase [Pseudomonas resinovorans]